MASITTLLGLSCALFLSLYVSRAPAKPAMATRSADKPLPVAKRYIGHEYLDFRWRMMSAMSYLNMLSSNMADRYEDTTLVVHLNEDYPNHAILNNILNRVCNIMAFYELAIKVNDTVDSTDFYILLDEILLDACKWVKYLVTDTDAMTGNPDFSSCSPSNVTPLHRYCYQSKVSNLVSMMDIGSYALYNYVTTYHIDDEIQLPALNNTRWRETSSIPNTPAVNALLAALQYMMDRLL